MMKKFCLVLSLFFFLFLKVYSQQKYYVFDIEAIGGYTTAGNVPFWLRSNHYGSVPLDNASISFFGSALKDYSKSKNILIDWGGSLSGRLNLGNRSTFTMIEGYGKLRISIFEIRAGRSKEIMGICDTSLSSGAFAVSGNALGIPKLQFGIPDFYSLPFFGKLFAFKGNFSHGWLGNIDMRFENSILKVNTYFHQKSLYGRFGRPEWKLKLYGGFSHQAFWGNEEDYYGDIFILSPIKTYFYVITGTAYGTNSIPRSKIGNQLGSIDFGVEYEFKNVKVLAYRQNFYDIGALYYLANIRDGLNGLSLVNKQYSGNKIQWKKLLIEVFYTKNQAGELWSTPVPSGDEDYYNNYQYVQGWSYKGTGLGNPFICSRASTREGLPSDPADYFINNRVVALHLGFEGSVKKLFFVTKASYTLNYGTFGTSVVGHTLGKVRTLPRYGIFKEIKQFSAYLEANKELKKGFNFGFISAFDSGGLYYNSIGLLIRVSKSF